MNNLFKLTKDGKCVGYMKFDGAKPLYQKYPFEGWHGNNDFTPLLCHCKITDLSMHPFVCNDKNGEKVFARDRVKRVTAEGDPKPSRKAGRTGTIVWHHGFLQWNFLDDKKQQLEDLADSEIFEAEIELIKDKDNE